MRWLPAVVALLPVACAQPPSPTGGDEVPERALAGRTVQDTFTLQDGWLVSDVLDAPTKATRVGLYFDAASRLSIQARGVRMGGAPTAWRDAEITWDEATLHVGRVDLGALVDGVQIRMTQEDAANLVGITFSAVVPAEPRARVAALPPSTSTRALDIAGVKSRADWGARATNCSDLNTTKTKISVHHTVTPSDQGGSQADFAARIRGIQAYHMDGNGWCDIGYHFMVTIDGTTWEAREAKYLGAHVLNNNTNNAGVSFIGCFHTSDCADYPPNAPPDAMLQGGGELIGKIADRYGIDVSTTTVIGHRDNPGQTTSCPGDNLHDELPTLRTIAGGTAPPAQTTGTVQGVVWDLSITTDAAQSEAMGARLPGATIARTGGGSTTSRAGDAYWSFDLPAGTYTLTATMDGYASASREVQVTAGGSQWASIGIAPVPQAVDLTVRVHDAADAAHAIESAFVTVTGLDPAQTLPDGTAHFSVAAGEVTITATAEGYQENSVVETFAAGTTRTIEIGLDAVVVQEPPDEEPPPPVEEPPPVDEDPPVLLPPASTNDDAERVTIPAKPQVEGGCSSTSTTTHRPAGALFLLGVTPLLRRRARRGASPSSS